jgi:hypothetical protein
MTTAALRVFLLCLCSALPATAQEDPAAPAMEFVIIKPGTFRMGCSEGDKLCDPEMTGFWKVTRGDKDLLYKLTRATRAPGSYRVVWNGRDDDGKRVPRGTYRVVIETNRYHGEYAKAAGTIVCESEASSITLAGGVNYDTIKVQYGPRPSLKSEKTFNCNIKVARVPSLLYTSPALRPGQTIFLEVVRSL